MSENKPGPAQNDDQQQGYPAPGQQYPQQDQPRQGFGQANQPGQQYQQQGYPAPGQQYPQQGFDQANQPGQQYPQQGYPAPGQQYPQQGYGQMPQGPYGQAYVAQKSRLAAGLLGIFLGGLGIHRFYLGHIGMGIVQLVLTLVTFGIASLWGFIEGIMILCGAQMFQRDSRGVPLRD